MSHTQPPTDQLIRAIKILEDAGLLDVHHCHITGEHNPRHFEDGLYVCSFQEQEAFRNIRRIGGLHESPVEAHPIAGCYWCDHKKITGPVLVGGYPNASTKVSR